MPDTAILRTTTDFSGSQVASMPRANLDPQANANTYILYDFLNPLCWENQAAPAQDDEVLNLAGPQDSFTMPSTVPGAFSGGGFVINNTSQEFGIDISNLSLTGKTHDLFFSVWLKRPAAVGGATLTVLGASNTSQGSSNNHVWIGGNTDQTWGLRMNGEVITGDSSNVPLVPNQVINISGYYKMGTGAVSKLYANGAQVGTDGTPSKTSYMSLLSEAGSLVFNKLNNFTQTVYRVHIATDIEGLSLDPDTLALNEYNYRNGSYS